MHHSTCLQWRLARAEDIDELVRIDDDTVSLFVAAGLDLSAPSIVVFAEAERARWLSAAQRGLVQLALDPTDCPIGFCALGYVDGAPYLEQLSVARDWMRRGVGRALLAYATRWAAAQGPLWLTTYAHLPWNGPMYERAGFTRVDERDIGPELRAILDEQRAALPDPAQRIAMVRR